MSFTVTLAGSNPLFTGRCTYIALSDGHDARPAVDEIYQARSVPRVKWGRSFLWPRQGFAVTANPDEWCGQVGQCSVKRLCSSKPRSHDRRLAPEPTAAGIGAAGMDVRRGSWPWAIEQPPGLGQPQGIVLELAMIVADSVGA